MIAILKDFVTNQIQSALPFIWKDFRDDSQCNYRLPNGEGSITYKWDSGDIWIVSIEMEKLP